MARNKTYKSDALAAIHETASDYYAAGVIDKQTMRHFDEARLTPVHQFTGKEIRALREREGVSQRIFALYMNVSKDAVSQWERDEKRPAGPTLKLLSLIKKRVWRRLLENHALAVPPFLRRLGITARHGIILFVSLRQTTFVTDIGFGKVSKRWLCLDTFSIHSWTLVTFHELVPRMI